MKKTTIQEQNKRMFEASGEVGTDDKFMIFIYFLCRDYLPPGAVEKVMSDVDNMESAQLTNGWMAQYARDVADRLAGVINLEDDVA